MGYEAQLAAQLSHYISNVTYKPSKPGQTDLVFGLWSEFIIRSVYCRITTHKSLTLKVYSSICDPG